MKSAAASRPILNEQETFAKLASIGQEKLLVRWKTLSQAQKEALQRQITYLDVELLKRLQAASEVHPHYTLEPPQAFVESGDLKRREVGKKLVQEGKAALLVLAGGQGSRLRYNGPKGCYEVTWAKRKSLFQLLAEKVKAAGKQAGRALEVAIMTSPLNHVEIETFFSQHAFFGLSPYQVTFFSQKMWPLLDFTGNLFLEGPDQIARGPNGNGGVFERFVETGIWEKWNKIGVACVNVVPIDNPLADPFDFELFGAHALADAEVTIKATLKRDADEKVGVLAQVEGRTAVVEYSELSAADRYATLPDGSLKFGIANLSLFCFSMPFLKKMEKQLLPLHRAQKAVKAMDSEGNIIFPEKPNAWKFEEFIFDTLPFAQKVTGIVYPREACFAPLKNLKGEDSIDTVQAALLAFDRRVYEEVTGVKPPQDARFELAPPFYYPTEEILKKWKGEPLPNEDYIHE